MSARPKLGALAVGDEVFVVRSSNDMRRRPDSDRYQRAEVTKVARVWITLASVGTRFPHEWRMRLDDQNDGSDYPGSSERFVTAEQRTYEETTRAAIRYLSEQGIRIDTSRSPWYGREVALAEALKKAIDQ